MQNTNLYTQLKARYERFAEQVSSLDRKLTLEYGDRYTTIKRKIDSTQECYKESQSEAERSGVSPHDRQQETARDLLAQAGSKAARQENAIKQKVKTLWHNLTHH